MEKIVRKYMVRPSFPTPHKLKTHKLSSIDQVMPFDYVPLIFFYDNDKSKAQEEIVQRLKQSLSEILTVFYPLAGTINGNSFVDCDDSGSEIVEARVEATLSQFIQNPKMEELTRLLPVDDTSSVDTILLVKASFFDCGGMAIGVCLSHKVADAASMVLFMNAWAATCRGGEASRTTLPAFDLAVHFPTPDNLPAFDYTRAIEKIAPDSLPALDYTRAIEKIAAKRFVFDGGKMEKLRKEACSSSNGDGGAKNPTKFEAVSAFIWQSIIKAYTATETTKTTTSFVASHAVNMRPRAVPPFPNHTFGNCATVCYSVVGESGSASLGNLVSKLRASTKRIDSDLINEVIKGKKNGDTLSETHDLLANPLYCLFSSWRFPVYEADFGWGKPVWVSPGLMHFVNLAILMDTPSKDGIEAWVNLPQHHHFFQIFQANYDKLLA